MYIFKNLMRVTPETVFFCNEIISMSLCSILKLLLFSSSNLLHTSLDEIARLPDFPLCVDQLGTLKTLIGVPISGPPRPKPLTYVNLFKGSTSISSHVIFLLTNGIVYPFKK